MTAKADLLRALKDRQRSEEVVRAECLGIARKRKMSTEAIARVGVELGVALRSRPGKPTTVEEAVTSLVRIHFGGLERGSSEVSEEEKLLFHGCTQHPSLAQSASSIQSRGGRQVACRPVILPVTYLQNGSDHAVVASYSGLYEECDVEHINVFGLVFYTRQLVFCSEF